MRLLLARRSHLGSSSRRPKGLRAEDGRKHGSSPVTVDVLSLVLPCACAYRQASPDTRSDPKRWRRETHPSCPRLSLLTVTLPLGPRPILTLSWDLASRGTAESGMILSWAQNQNGSGCRATPAQGDCVP